MDLGEILRPTISKLIVLLVVFSFFPWPYEINNGDMYSYSLSFLCYGPLTLTMLLNIPLQYHDMPNSLEIIKTKLLTPQMISLYFIFLAFVLLCYLVACIVTYKSLVFKPTPVKSIMSFLILIAALASLTYLFIGNNYDETKLHFTIMGSFLIFDSFYILNSIIESYTKS